MKKTENPSGRRKDPGAVGGDASTSQNDTREQILKGALRCFAASGFDGTSIADIAREAGIRHPLVHYHFDNKDVLWRKAVEHAFGDIANTYAGVAMAYEDMEPVDALRLLCKVFVRFCGQYPEHVSILLLEAKSHSDRFDWLIETYLAPLHAQFDNSLERAVKAGQIRDLPAVHISNMMVGAAVQFVATRALISRLYQVDALDPQSLKAQAEILVDVFFNGLLPRD